MPKDKGGHGSNPRTHTEGGPGGAFHQIPEKAAPSRSLWRYGHVSQQWHELHNVDRFPNQPGTSAKKLLKRYTADYPGASLHIGVKKPTHIPERK